jgi:dihydroorotate dehydrogenase
MAGATAVQLGTATFANHALLDVVKASKRGSAQAGVGDVNEIIGCALPAPAVAG